MYLPIIKPIVKLVLRILTFLLCVLTIAAAYSGRVNPEYSKLAVLLSLAFPYLLVATAIATLCWLIARNFITAAIGVLSLIAIWGEATTVSPLHFSKKADYPENTFKLITWNIFHAHDQRNNDSGPGNPAIDYLIEQNADIVCLQEALSLEPGVDFHNFTPALRDSLKRVYPYEADGADDVKVLSKYPVQRVPCTGTEVREYYFSLYRFDIKGTYLYVLNIHLFSNDLNVSERGIVHELASGSETKEGLKELKTTIFSKIQNRSALRGEVAASLNRYLATLPEPIIVCGDLNDVPTSYAYRQLRGDLLRDAYAETGFGPMITYNRHAFWFRLDHIFYRGPIEALSVKKGKIDTSDHYPLIAEFEIIPQNPINPDNSR